MTLRRGERRGELYRPRYDIKRGRGRGESSLGHVMTLKRREEKGGELSRPRYDIKEREEKGGAL